jgi:hypothetical protein
MPDAMVFVEAAVIPRLLFGFVEPINKHDVDKLVAIVTEDHVFTDSF